MDYTSPLTSVTQGSLYLFLQFTDVYGEKIQYKDRNFHSASVNTNYFSCLLTNSCVIAGLFSSGHFYLHLLTADCLSVVVNSSTGMLTAPSIIFQHAAVPLPELSVGVSAVLRDTESVSVSAVFPEEPVHHLVTSAFTEFLWKKNQVKPFFLNVLHIWCC